MIMKYDISRINRLSLFNYYSFYFYLQGTETLVMNQIDLTKLLYEKCLSDKELMQEILEDYVFLREKTSNDLEQLRTNLQGA